MVAVTNYTLFDHRYHQYRALRQFLKSVGCGTDRLRALSLVATLSIAGLYVFHRCWLLIIKMFIKSVVCLISHSEVER